MCCFKLCVFVFLDNHDLVSFKLYELTVERSPEEEEEDQLEITLPSVDYRVDPNGNAFRKHSFLCKACDLMRKWMYLTFVFLYSAHTADEGRSILATFFIFIFSVFALVVVVIVILFAYNHYKENRRKRFY